MQDQAETASPRPAGLPGRRPSPSRGGISARRRSRGPFGSEAWIGRRASRIGEGSAGRISVPAPPVDARGRRKGRPDHHRRGSDAPRARRFWLLASRFGARGPFGSVRLKRCRAALSAGLDLCSSCPKAPAEHETLRCKRRAGPPGKKDGRGRRQGRAARPYTRPPLPRRRSHRAPTPSAMPPTSRRLASAPLCWAGRDVYRIISLKCQGLFPPRATRPRFSRVSRTMGKARISTPNDA